MIRAKITETREDEMRVLANPVIWLPPEKQSELRRAFKEWFNRILLPKHLPGTEFNEVLDLTDTNHISRTR